MTCDWTKENVVLYIYDELPDDARYEFEHHVRHCLACKQEVEAALALKESMSLAPVQEISPNLLADSRLGHKILRGGIRNAATLDDVTEDL